MLPDEQSDAERDLAPDPDPETADADVPAALKRQFWVLVVVFNVAMLATSLGVMLVYFRGQFATGGGVAFLGVGAFYYGWRRYQRVRREGFRRD